MSTDYRKQFKSCGKNVTLAPDVYIEHPEVMEVGDNVNFMRGVYMTGKAKTFRLGNNVTFSPYCHLGGSNSELIVENNVKFYPGNCIEIGDWESSFIHIGHDSHFAPGGLLYGWGGLEIGPYCNIAAHTVFATVGHHEEIKDKPMALTGEKAGPITLVEDVWICANVTITANTKIAKGCVIAANAALTKDADKPFGIYGGVPAKFLRSR